jgi:radical SAM protein with 4Fe4S-binding SPASM domain
MSIIGDGEPTCNPYFYEALYEGKKAGLSLATSTNGVLLNTAERRRAILENCEWMKFTISAGTREGYKLIHQRDDFDKVTKNIKAMIKERKDLGSKCEIGMHTIFVPTLMATEIIDEAKLAIDLGVDYFLVKQCSLPDAGQSGMMQFDLSDYDKPEIRQALQHAENLSTDKTEVIIKWGLIKDKGKKPYKGCPGIPLLIQVSGNGDVYPCGHMFGDKPQFLKYKMGNLHETRLSDIVNSDKYWEIIKEMRYNFDVQTQCHGNCRHDRLNEFLAEYLDKPKGINFI